jgi:hypothetical protein
VTGAAKHSPIELVAGGVQEDAMDAAGLIGRNVAEHGNHAGTPLPVMPQRAMETDHASGDVVGQRQCARAQILLDQGPGWIDRLVPDAAPSIGLWLLSCWPR